MRPGERRLYPVCTHGQLINRAAGPRLSRCAGSSCTSRWRTGSVHPLVCQRRRRQVKAYAQPPVRRGWLLPHLGSSSPSMRQWNRCGRWQYSMRAAAQKPALGQRDGGLLRSALLRPQGPPLESTPTLSSSLSLLSQRSSFRLGWPAARGGAAVILTVHEAWPAARARRASGRSEAARWRAGGPDGGRLAVSSPVEALRL